MRTLSVAQGVAWRTLHNVFTNPALFIPSLLFPLFFFTAFAGGLSGIARTPGFDFPDGYTAFQFVFVLLQSAAFGGVFTGFGIARDFEGGFARRLLLAAPNRSGIVLGYAAAAFVRWLVTAAVLTVIALLVGMNVGGSGIDLFGLYGLGLLINMASVLWAAGVAMRLQTMQAGPMLQMPVFLVLFFAPVYGRLRLLDLEKQRVQAVRAEEERDPGARAHAPDTDDLQRKTRHGLRHGGRSCSVVLALGAPWAAQGRGGRLAGDWR